ncbi:metallophosphoesterase family protein [Limnochorda pilosa]|uniref:Protein phosphatase n=1 Tax=Limnochorda pilosa TaxID=1555112 RepID=A0A0K2SI00_LIMPI|nr:metallophosphoesterase family protein [Limnochorda pilosa]BAS26479.1 protein phosphatase [Limnochorda pilosa]
MRLALISDIHGNAVALDAVLEAIEQEGVDRIVCLGDVAATGPQPREAAARLRGLGCPVVMGNTDAFLLSLPPLPEDAGKDTRMVWEIDQWGAGQLTTEDRAFLTSFQPTVEVSLGGADALLCFHGSPRSNTEVILPTTPDQALEEALAGNRHALLAGGHTHQAMVRRHQRSTLVNPGSVGLPFDRVPPGEGTRNPAWAEYAIVTWTDGRKSVDLRRVRYSLEALLKAVRESGMPYAERFAEDWVQE